MKRNKEIYVTVTLLMVMVFLILAIPRKENPIYFYNYLVDGLCFLVALFLLMYRYLKGKLDLFDPLTIIGVLYITMYFVAPIYDMMVGEYLWFDYDVFPYGIKATAIAFAGFIAFYFFYTCKFNIWITKRKKNNNKNKIKYMPVNRSILKIIIIVMYVFAIFTNIYYLVRVSGNSVLYIFSLGMLGSGNTVEKTEEVIGFLSNFSYSLPTITLLYWEYGENKIVKTIMFAAMFMLQVARGFRFFVIQIAITCFTYYFLKRHKRPKIKQILLVLGVMSVPIILMTLFRESIRAGKGMEVSIINLDLIKQALDAAIWENFRIYRNFYALVNKVPAQYPFVYGRQMFLGTLVMMIPRIIWPGKISTQAGMAIEYIVGMRLKGTGQVQPNIGEYYYAFGVLGVIIFMAIYGVWARHVRVRFKGSSDGLNIITYSVLLGANLQLIIRGYTPSNFWYLFFSLLPVWFIKFYMKKKKYEMQ